jgi:hypothetical protein
VSNSEYEEDVEARKASVTSPDCPGELAEGFSDVRGDSQMSVVILRCPRRLLEAPILIICNPSIGVIVLVAYCRVLLLSAKCVPGKNAGIMICVPGGEESGRTVICQCGDRRCSCALGGVGGHCGVCWMSARTYVRAFRYSM